MRKIAIFVLVTLLIVSGISAAWAYNTATVTNAGQIKIANTTESLLALRPGNGVGNKDLTAEVDNGNLIFTFGQGYGGNFYGLQKNSTYVWGGPKATSNPLGLFTVWNRSEETIHVKMKVTGLPTGVKMYFAGRTYSGDMSPWVNVSDGNFHLIPCSTWYDQFSPNCSSQISVKIVVDDTATFTATDDIEVIVKGIAQY